jgi:hypothetical protein
MEVTNKVERDICKECTNRCYKGKIYCTLCLKKIGPLLSLKILTDNLVSTYEDPKLNKDEK